MLSGVCIGTNDLEAASAFYDKVMATIGMKRTVNEPNEIGYAGSDGKTTFFVLTPYNEKPASFGNGTQVMFYAANEAGVKAFHAMVLQCGGKDDGAPGPRNYHPGYYGAYARDLDGNKLHVAIELG